MEEEEKEREESKSDAGGAIIAIFFFSLSLHFCETLASNMLVKFPRENETTDTSL